MPRTTLPHLLLAALWLAPLVLSQGLLQTYTGCVLNQYIQFMPSYAPLAGTYATTTDCATACAGNTGMMYNAANGVCSCGAGGGQDMYFARVPANDPAACAAAGGSITYKLGSPFVFQGVCFTQMTRDQRDIDAGGQQPADQTWDSCLALCADWVYTFFGWTDLSGCYCANHWPTSTSGDTTICGPRIFFPFKQDLPSGAPARRRRARAELQRQQVLASNPYCPVGSEACRVAPEAGVGYECLHTQDELESCGGCRYGVHGSAGNGTATGVDCTSIPGVKPGGVTCSRGECVVSACSKGFVRRGNSCV